MDAVAAALEVIAGGAKGVGGGKKGKKRKVKSAAAEAAAAAAAGSEAADATDGNRPARRAEEVLMQLGMINEGIGLEAAERVEAMDLAANVLGLPASLPVALLNGLVLLPEAPNTALSGEAHLGEMIALAITREAQLVRALIEEGALSEGANRTGTEATARAGELHSALLEVLLSRGKVAPFYSASLHADCLPHCMQVLMSRGKVAPLYSAQLALSAKDETVRDAIRAAAAAADGEVKAADGQAAASGPNLDGQAAASGEAAAAAEATQLAGVVRIASDCLCHPLAGVVRMHGDRNGERLHADGFRWPPSDPN